MPRSFSRVLTAVLLALGLWSLGAHTAAAADQCAPVKAKADCNKKAGCAWNGKACAAKAAAKPAGKPTAAGKPAPKAGAKAAAGKPAAKPATAAKKPEAKPAEPPATTAPTAEPPIDEEMPAGDGEAEDF